METTSHHGKLEGRMTRVERSLNPLKSTTRSLSNRQHALESSVSALAWSVHSMASSVNAMQQPHHYLQPQQKPPHIKREPAELTSERISERISHLERAVRRCEAAQDRLADIAGTAFQGHLEASLASLETRLLRQQAASEQRMQAVLSTRLDRIEAALLEQKQLQDGISFEASFGNSFTDTMKLEDMLQLL
jgi:chromosome segregation ATPase